MAGEENVVDVREAELVFLDLPGGERLGFVAAVDVATAIDLDADGSSKPGMPGLAPWLISSGALFG